MPIALITPPAVEPVTVVEAKAELRVDHAEDDTVLSALIVAARNLVETRTATLMITQVWRLYRDAWPASGVFEVPIGPLQAVGAVTVADTAGTPVPLPVSAYRVDAVGRPGRIALAPGVMALPGVPFSGIAVDVTVGFGASGLAVPQPLRRAVMMLVARWYENPRGLGLGAVPPSLADPFEALIAPYRPVRL